MRAVVSVLVLLCAAVATGEERSDPCSGYGTALLLFTGPHVLRQCESGITLKMWGVALGAGGVNKLKAGDRRTPLGSYPLGEPRTSRRFGTFIPVGYPTPEQRRLGYTGGDIGIHGPLRAYRDLGTVNLASDWTLGCIAVESDQVIGEITAWVRKKHVRSIEIL